MGVRDDGDPETPRGPFRASAQTSPRGANGLPHSRARGRDPPAISVVVEGANKHRAVLRCCARTPSHPATEPYLHFYPSLETLVGESREAFRRGTAAAHSIGNPDPRSSAQERLRWFSNLDPSSLYALSYALSIKLYLSFFTIGTSFPVTSLTNSISGSRSMT